jgi:hypothetical protein
MALTRVYEEHEVSPELRRIYSDIRVSFDLPFVPTIFKVLAGRPEYLRAMWDDLAPVARSREFHGASQALEEFARSQVISGGWQFSDQKRILATQKFSGNDAEQLAAVAATFARALPRTALFTALMQRGYSGGQSGRVSAAKQASALSRMITLHVPNEREAGLRVWLIYADIRKTTGAKNVLSLFRVLSPFPGYLAAVWVDAKKLLNDPALQRARKEVTDRVRSLLVGLPVKDHRKVITLRASDWNQIEETVDGYVRLLPQFALISAAWQRSLPRQVSMMVA